MNVKNEAVTLLIPEKTDVEFEEVFAVWTTAGGYIRRLGKYFDYGGMKE